MSDGDRLALAERLEQTLRVMQGARRSNSKTMSVWPDDTKNVEDALFALRAERRDEAVAWLVPSDETGFCRIWWRDKERADAWIAKHPECTLVPLYAHPAASQGGQLRDPQDEMQSCPSELTSMLAMRSGQSQRRKSDEQNYQSRHFRRRRDSCSPKRHSPNSDGPRLA